MKKIIEKLDNLNEIKNCKSIIVTLQRGSFKGEKIGQILFKRQNFDYIITNNVKYIEINTEESKDGTELFEEFLNFFELIFIFYGYFPKVSKILFESDTGEFLTINKEKYLVSKYTTFKEHKKDYNKLIDIDTIDNLSEILDKWIKLKKLLGLCISGMLLSQTNVIPYCDVITVTLLQSCEGYITRHIFPQKNKYANCEVNIGNTVEPEIKLIERLKPQEKKNLKFSEKLKIFIKDFEEQVLKQEYNKKYNQENNDKNDKIFDSLDIFLEKCRISRNRLSHMNEEGKQCFEGFENWYALFKLLLIFRLNLIVDLGLEDNIIKSNIDLNVYYTEKWYYELSLKSNKKE